MKSRTLKRSRMLSGVNSSPRGLSACPPFSMTSAARGMSWVITTSPGESRRTISLSATSMPAPTCTIETSFERGM